MDKTSKTFYANGKLLLTGEYLVMLGAKALAIPVKYGQSLKITKNSGNDKFVWIANESGIPWFKAVFTSNSFNIEETTDSNIADRLRTILLETAALNSEFLNETCGTIAETNLNFNRMWGLGTSSTLIANIANWANIDPFILHRKVSDGSGYDIACANISSAIIYQVSDQLQIIEPVKFKPVLGDSMYFVYLEKKQDSAISIENFPKDKILVEKDINHISDLTNKFSLTNSLKEAIQIMEEHETIIGKILNCLPVKETLFPDFQGGIKSLGAWGGDFVLVISSLDKTSLTDYFRKRGYPIIIPFREMIIQEH